VVNAPLFGAPFFTPGASTESRDRRDVGFLMQVPESFKETDKAQERIYHNY
jgi:hypothetical protein